MATCCSLASPTSQDSGSLFKLASDRGFLTYTGKFGGERHAVPHDNSIQFLIRKVEQDDSRGSHFLHIWIPFFLQRGVPLGFQACERYFWATPSRGSPRSCYPVDKHQHCQTIHKKQQDIQTLKNRLNKSTKSNLKHKHKHILSIYIFTVYTFKQKKNKEKQSK